MTDPVKDKSGFLCMYMSGHPDTLVAYAKHFGNLKARDVVSAKMVSIDSNVGMRVERSAWVLTAMTGHGPDIHH